MKQKMMTVGIAYPSGLTCTVYNEQDESPRQTTEDQCVYEAFVEQHAAGTLLNGGVSYFQFVRTAFRDHGYWLFESLG
jgi:hypothetical protein